MGSSQRFKDHIKPMGESSEAILALKPVSFRYKTEIDPDGTPQFGLIAEDVQKVDPDLVVSDENDKVYTVRYEAVNAMLLNEFLKEHHQLQDLKAIVAEQQKQISALTSGLQKVSAQMELSKSAPQTVENNQ
jgi:trimeric autotransporter adhesin